MAHLCDIARVRRSICGTDILVAVLFGARYHAVVDCVIVLW